MGRASHHKAKAVKALCSYTAIACIAAILPSWSVVQCLFVTASCLHAGSHMWHSYRKCRICWVTGKLVKSASAAHLMTAP